MEIAITMNTHNRKKMCHQWNDRFHIVVWSKNCIEKGQLVQMVWLFQAIHCNVMRMKHIFHMHSTVLFFFLSVANANANTIQINETILRIRRPKNCLTNLAIINNEMWTIWQILKSNYLPDKRRDDDAFIRILADVNSIIAGFCSENQHLLFHLI